ncbi:hypothetical protein H0I76_18560 [Limibaculum sp. M0105]|uniref:Uncharacterized protein n=1 Tax=Thermohalobaculum xanthum TaxID=2753746 RepID=A0A8J7SGV0_9RHOB|nr:hypothetical protein [Thermohalobaculum xanthum]MBK0401206.1 hypothetical protein [Thermohalobaculum xanthum]
MGDFDYAPARTGGLSPNQLQNTAAGSIYIGEDVASYVRRATALEMQKAGVDIAEGNGRMIEGEVLELMADDLGYSVDWSYAITYRVVDASTKREMFSKTYRPEPRKTGKFGNPSDYTPSVNLLILDAAEQFMADVKRDGLLATTLATR